MLNNKGAILILTALVFLAAGYPDDLELKKSIRGYQVEIKINKNPPVIGDNKIEIQIKDASDSPVIDAKVLVNYYMPPMPRMAPMNYKTEAKLKDEKYRAKMKIIMAGPWIIAVKFSREGKTLTAKFNIDAG
jgi:hypothetical protein